MYLNVNPKSFPFVLTSAVATATTRTKSISEDDQDTVHDDKLSPSICSVGGGGGSRGGRGGCDGGVLLTAAGTWSLLLLLLLLLPLFSCMCAASSFNCLCGVGECGGDGGVGAVVGIVGNVVAAAVV